MPDDNSAGETVRATGELYTWEIVNPSDAYTIQARSFAVAAAAGLLLGRGRYGLTPVDGQPDTVQSLPVFLFGGSEQFVAEHFDGDLDTWIDDHAIAIAQSLEGVLLGGPGRRRDYEAALEAIDDEGKLAAFKAQWHDKRTSLNDIGGVALETAQWLRDDARARAST